jgi:hypothetical protein
MVAERCVEGHTAYIMDRGGFTRIGQLVRLEAVTWERDRDGTSEANVVISGGACAAQRGLLNRIITKRHELLIYRGTERVWEGPIFRVGDEGDSVTINARDVSAYIFARALSRDWDNRWRAKYDGDDEPVEIYTQPTEVTTRLEQIITYELTTNTTARSALPPHPYFPITAWENLDPPANVLPHLRVHHWPNEARTSAFTRTKEMTVGEHMTALARTAGVDWTVVGRSLHIWDVSRSLGRTRVLTEEDFFGNIIVTEYGADHVQIAHVAGGEGQQQTPIGDPVFYSGTAANPENLDLYGPWESVFTAYNEEGTQEPSTPELNSQAQRNTNGRSPVPFEVRVPDNSTIRLDNSLTIRDLVPGVQMPLRATLNARQWSQMQKLDHVRVVETAEGETVSVILTPATKPDDDEPEE